MWPGVDMHAIVASHRGLVEGGQTFASPGVFVDKSGGEIIADVSVIPLYPERGIGFAVIKDKTQQVLSRKALRTSEEKYRRVFENSPMVIVSSRLDGLIEMASPSVSDVAGYDADEIVGSGQRLKYLDKEASNSFHYRCTIPHYACWYIICGCGRLLPVIIQDI